MRIGFAMLALLLAPGVARAYTVKRTPSGAAVRWQRDRVTLELYRMEGRAPGQVRRAAEIAADAWTGLGGPDLEVSPRVEPGPYRMGEPGARIAMPAEWPHAPHLLAVTATSYVEGSGSIVAADILLNPATDAVLLEEGDADHERYDLGALLTHEAGHVLGLGESDADPLATMWARIGRGDTHQRTIELDDESGIAEAYAGVALMAPSGCGGARVAHRQGRTALWGCLVALLAALAWLTWRHRNTEGVRRRAARERRRGVGRAPVAGVLTFGALVFLWPMGPPGEPESVRAARALAAPDRPAAERSAMLAAAALDPAPSVRRAAVRAVLSDPRRGDRAMASLLIDDTAPEIAALARTAFDRARRARPARIVEASEAPAAVRALLVEGRLGRARVLEVRRDAIGMLRTRIDVDGAIVEIPGGCLAGRCQQIGEEPLPVDGEQLRVDPTTGAWVRSGDGIAWGGWLGAGPAVRIALAPNG